MDNSVGNLWSRLRISHLVHHRQGARGVKDQAVTEFVVSAENHQQTGALIGNLQRLAGDAVTHGFPGFHHHQHVAFGQTVPLALVQRDHVHRANLRDAPWHIDDQAVDLALGRAGHEGRVDGPLFAAEQAVAEAHFLGGALQRQGRNVAFGRNNFAAANVIGVDPQELLALRIGVDLALAEDAVHRLVRVEMPARENAIPGAAEHPFGITSDDIGRLVEILDLVDDAVAQQKTVDRLQRNARDRVGHRTAADPWRELDGAPGLAAIERQARLAVDVSQRQQIPWIDEIGVLDLWIDLPELGPLPRFAQEFPGDVPKCVAPYHGVLLRKTFPELHLPVRQTGRGQKEQGE